MTDCTTPASKEMVMSLLRLGRESLEKPVVAFNTTVDGYPVTLGARDKKTFQGMVKQLVIGVDILKAKAAALPVDRELDMWLMRQESALNALFRPWLNFAPPYLGRHLYVDRVDPEGSWVAHIATFKERYRNSNWVVTQPVHA